MKKKILVTGGDGRFSKDLRKENKKLNLLFKNKKECNILNIKSIIRCIKKSKPNLILHCAGLSRPMELHEKNISKSIDLNIVGTANVVKACSMFNIKLVYISSGYIYNGSKGNYKEEDGANPFNNYGWSKLGGECSVAMYNNSLILRVTMIEKPFVYKTAYTNLITNLMFHEDFVKILPKLINKKGILNVGGKTQSVFNFVKKTNLNIKKARLKKSASLPLFQSMNLSKLKKII